MKTQTVATSMTRRAWIVLAAGLGLAAAACAATPPAARTASQTNQEPQEKAMTKRILMAVTSHDKKGATGEPTGAYVPEMAHPLAVFKAAGYEVELVSTRGGQVPLDGVERKDPVVAAFLDDPELQRQLRESPASTSIDASRYDAIFFAGGHGAMWDFPDAKGFTDAAARIYDAGGVVGAVCHGPAALVSVRLANGKLLIDGKQVSAFTNDEEKAVKLDQVVPFLLQSRLEALGARHQAAPNWQEKVVTSERLVTGQNPASAAGVARAMVAKLEQAR
jgi:putative intracellular protease/amidase